MTVRETGKITSTTVARFLWRRWNYVSGIAGGKGLHVGGKAQLTQPDGTPVAIDLAMVRSVRAPLPGEYADGVQAVVTIGKKKQGVRETVPEARRLTLS